MTKLWGICGLLAISLSPAYAASNFFCPGGNQTVSVGMTEAQVSAACGKPLAIQKNQGAATEKVPVQQLIFNEAGAPKAFYGVWQLAQGHDTGSQLTVSVINDKVVRIDIDGGGVNINSVCHNGGFTTGDLVSKVYYACGNPTAINNTFTERVLPGVKKPETWIYHFGQYQPPVRMRFQGGKLVGIENSSE